MVDQRNMKELLKKSYEAIRIAYATIFISLSLTYLVLLVMYTLMTEDTGDEFFWVSIGYFVTCNIMTQSFILLKRYLGIK